jgi:adenosylmethionine-8-amino-7-oxononanoate aminotransferase
MRSTQETFISSTYWTERVGPAVALAVLKKLKEKDVSSHVREIGLIAKKIWREKAGKHNLPVVVDDAFPCLAHFRFNHEKANVMKTLFIQLMLEKGFLAALTFYPTLAHTYEIMRKYSEALDSVFAELAEKFQNNSLEKSLKGPVAHQGFKRLIN